MHLRPLGDPPTVRALEHRDRGVVGVGQPEQAVGRGHGAPAIDPGGERRRGARIGQAPHLVVAPEPDEIAAREGACAPPGATRSSASQVPLRLPRSRTCHAPSQYRTACSLLTERLLMRSDAARDRPTTTRCPRQQVRAVVLWTSSAIAATLQQGEAVAKGPEPSVRGARLGAAAFM